MPVTAATLTPQLAASLGGVGIAGVRQPQLAQAVALGTVNLLRSARVQTAATGVSGVGVGTGRVNVDPVSGIATLAAALSGAGLAGPLTPSLAQGIVQGLATGINTQALVTTAVPGVATGVGTGALLGLTPASATPLYAAALAGVGFAGSQTPQLAAALGQGISAWLSTAVVTTAIAGTPTVPPVSAASVGTGQVT